MKKTLLAALLLLSAVLEAAVSVELEADKIAFGQSFKLILTEDNVKNFNMPDLSPLQNDFNILGTEQSSNYSLINGQASAINQWTIVLMPKRIGSLPIPALNFGQEKTKALSIEVLKSAEDPAQSKSLSAPEVPQKTFKELLLTAEVSNKKPFINEEVIYTVKLYKHQNLLDANFQPPTAQDALLVPLGAGGRYQASKDGQIYTVEEQRYALYPQKSGQIRINPPVLNALIYRNMPEQLRVVAQELSLNVQAKPKNISANWLPARNLLLRQSYDRRPSSLKEGDTVQRTITIEATGLPAQLLPPFELQKSQNFSLYQEKAEEKNLLKNKQLVGMRTIKLTYLFNKAGSIEIPAERLVWFNTKTQKEEEASLPAFNIKVAAGPERAEETQASASTVPVSKEAEKAKKPSPNTEDGLYSALLKAIKSNGTAWALAALFAILWLLTLWFRKMRPKDKKTETEKPAPLISKEGASKALKKACLQNQAQEAKSALLDWAQKHWPNHPFLDLSEVLKWVEDGPLKKEINTLIQALYQAETRDHSWNGTALWQSFAAFRTKEKTQKKKKRERGDVLPPSNPEV